MAGRREHLRQMRRDLHTEMQVPAYYVAKAGGSPLLVNVRLYVTFRTAEVGGVGEGFASQLDTTPRIKFDRTQVRLPARDAIVSVETGEAYRLGGSRKPVGDYIEVEATRISEADAINLPVPQ